MLPGVNDASMLMWVIYSCDGGTDNTKTNIATCSNTESKCQESYPCTSEGTCTNTGDFCQ